MRKSVLPVLGFLLTAAISHAQQATTSGTPVLVELFTSEGCSSCPPADRFIEYLDTQPIAGLTLIVLSEHVDYWNRQGWKDPFSSRDISERQYAYGQKFRLKDVYTPQFVVDGAKEVNANADEIRAVLKEASQLKKVTLELNLAQRDPQRVKVHLEADLRKGDSKQEALDIYLAIALDHAQTVVTAGENAKKTLSHTAVVRKITLIGRVRSGELLSRDIDLKTNEFGNSALRIVAFLQEQGSGRIHGAAMVPVSCNAAR